MLSANSEKLVSAISVFRVDNEPLDDMGESVSATRSAPQRRQVAASPAPARAVSPKPSLSSAATNKVSATQEREKNAAPQSESSSADEKDATEKPSAQSQKGASSSSKPTIQSMFANAISDADFEEF